MGKRLKPKNARDTHYGISRVLSQAYAQIIHLADIITDAQLASAFYELSREDVGKNS